MCVKAMTLFSINASPEIDAYANVLYRKRIRGSHTFEFIPFWVVATNEQIGSTFLFSTLSGCQFGVGRWRQPPISPFHRWYHHIPESIATKYHDPYKYIAGANVYTADNRARRETWWCSTNRSDSSIKSQSNSASAEIPEFPDANANARISAAHRTDGGSATWKWTIAKSWPARGRDRFGSDPATGFAIIFPATAEYSATAHESNGQSAANGKRQYDAFENGEWE